MATPDFSTYVQGKTFDEILHEGRRESAERLLSEAVTALALLLSEKLLQWFLASPERVTTSSKGQDL